VVVSSSDLEELADLCDRVFVIVDGKISSVLEGAELTEGNITRRFMPIAAVPAEAAATNGAHPAESRRGIAHGQGHRALRPDSVPNSRGV
jgi:ABC-type multidrug transport system ATPase subunit